MPINVTKVTADPALHNIDLQVEANDLQVIVKSGSFRLSGTDYQLKEDEEFIVVPDSEEQFVDAHLYLDVPSGEVHVLVDPIEHGGERYDWKDSDMKLLHSLFEVRVPANATTLDGVDISVVHIVPPEVSP